MDSTHEDEAFCQSICYPSCLPVCDELCPKLCPYSPPVEYDFPPPPPSQWYNDARNGSMSSAGIALICVLTFFLLGLGSCVIKRCSESAERSTLTQEADTRQDENQGPASGNRPRLILLSVGLPQDIIDSIQTRKYTGKNGSTGSTDCSVCLADFENDDMLKLLPRCNHTFHVQCINTWLISHTNCPLCRATVVLDQNYGTKTGQIPEDQYEQGSNLQQNHENNGDISNSLGSNTEAPDGQEVACRRSDHILNRSDDLGLKRQTDSTSSSSKSG